LSALCQMLLRRSRTFFSTMPFGLLPVPWTPT